MLTLEPLLSGRRRSWSRKWTRYGEGGFVAADGRLALRIDSSVGQTLYYSLQ